MFWNSEYECLPREDLEKLQIELFRGIVEKARQTPYYSKIFSESRLSGESVNSMEDVRRFPFTEKDHLRSGFPYQFLAVPREEVVRVHVSSGTTGVPTAVYHTRNDIEIWADSMARCLYMAGMRKEDVFQNMTGYGLFTGGLGLHYGAEKVGAMVIPSGTGNSRRQITLMSQLGTTVFHIIPSYALKLLDTFEELEMDPRDALQLRIAVVGAEPHSEETRRRIEEAYGVFAVNSYGLSEMNGPGVAFECPFKTGLHLWEDRYLLEIIDPSTLEPVDEGETGEVVLTTLQREAMPLIRYRTRDLAAIRPGPCPCGRTHRRLSRILGRTDDMFIIKGVNIYPIQIERVLMRFQETGNNYDIFLEREDDVDRIRVRVETVGETGVSLSPEERNRFVRRITQALKDEILVTPVVELMEPGSIVVSEGKAKRVFDHRKL